MGSYQLLLAGIYLGLFLALALVITRLIYALFFSPLRQVPGPLLCKITGLCLTYHESRLSRNQRIFEWHQKYGDAIVIEPGHVSFSRSSTVKDIYSAAMRHPKSAYFDRLSAFGFRSIFMVRDHVEHQKMRKRTFRCYQPASVYSPAMLGSVRDLAKHSRDRLRADIMQQAATIDMFARCNSFSFDNITRFALGPHLCSNAVSELAIERCMFIGWEECEVWGPFGSNFPWVQNIIKTFVQHTSNEAFLTGDDRLAAWTVSQVAKGMHDLSKCGEDSLLRQLLEVKLESGVKLSLEEIAEEIFDNFLAAQSVVTNALVFLLWDLACHPEWQASIRMEMQTLPTEQDGLPTFAGINSLPILDACVQESSRVHPLASGRAERVIQGMKTYQGIALPAGTIVSSSTKALHYDAEIFPDPLLFTPQRWTEATADQLSSMKKSFMPYGQGARICLGIPFALAQMKLLIAFLLLEFEFLEDTTSMTSTASMRQLGTQSALPQGLRCDLRVRRLHNCSMAEK